MKWELTDLVNMPSRPLWAINQFLASTITLLSMSVNSPAWVIVFKANAVNLKSKYINILHNQITYGQKTRIFYLLYSRDWFIVADQVGYAGGSISDRDIFLILLQWYSIILKPLCWCWFKRISLNLFYHHPLTISWLCSTYCETHLKLGLHYPILLSDRMSWFS